MEIFTGPQPRRGSTVAPAPPDEVVPIDREATPVRWRQPRRVRRPTTLRFLVPLVTTLALVGVWEVAARTGAVPVEVPGPTAVVGWLAGQLGQSEIWVSIGQTLQQTLLGLLAGSAVGVALGIALGETPILYRLLQSSIEFLRPIPGIVYLPVVILLFGVQSKTSIILVAVAVVWPMLFQTLYGVRDVDPMLKDTGRVFGLKFRQRLVNIIAPSILPYLVTGVRISLSVALVVAISVELITGVAGLGWDLTQYQQAANYPAVYGIVVLSGILGMLANHLMLSIEKRSLHWHVSHRNVRREPCA